MAHLSLTPLLIKSSFCPEGKRKADYFDTDCKGLMLEVRASGGKTYALRYQDARGKTRQMRLADAADISLAQARSLADKFRNQIAMGDDPAEERALLRRSPTLGDFIRNDYLPYVKSYKRSWITDEGLLRNHVEPVWGKRHLDQITRQDVVSLITTHRLTHAPGSCNRLLILIRYVFNLAIRWEVAGLKANPTTGTPLMEENNKRERYLSADEASRLYNELAHSENRMLQYIVPMLILTGARKREVLDAKWVDFDIERRIWRIPVNKSGKPRHVPISDGAVALLSRIPRPMGCPWAFANPDTGKPFVSMYASWHTARTNVGLGDVRIHDLRHSFASFLVNGGRSLYEVQKILGHTQAKTTQRYAHLSQDSLVSAANAAARFVPQPEQTVVMQGGLPALPRPVRRPRLRPAPAARPTAAAVKPAA